MIYNFFYNLLNKINYHRGAKFAELNFIDEIYFFATLKKRHFVKQKIICNFAF